MMMITNEGNKLVLFSKLCLWVHLCRLFPLLEKFTLTLGACYPTNGCRKFSHCIDNSRRMIREGGMVCCAVWPNYANQRPLQTCLAVVTTINQEKQLDLDCQPQNGNRVLVKQTVRSNIHSGQVDSQVKQIVRSIVNYTVR